MIQKTERIFVISQYFRLRWISFNNVRDAWLLVLQRLLEGRNKISLEKNIPIYIINTKKNEGNKNLIWEILIRY